MMISIISIYLVLTTVETRSTVDDEYLKIGVEDPRVLVTTSRNPSSRLMQFAKVCLLGDTECNRRRKSV